MTVWNTGQGISFQTPNDKLSKYCNVMQKSFFVSNWHGHRFQVLDFGYSYENSQPAILNFGKDLSEFISRLILNLIIFAVVLVV